MQEFLPAVCEELGSGVNGECGKPATWIMLAGDIGTTICKACVDESAEQGHEVVVLFSLGKSRLERGKSLAVVDAWGEGLDSKDESIRRATIRDIIRTQWEYVESQSP